MSAQILASIFSRVEMSKSESCVLRAILTVTNRRGQSGTIAHAALAGATGYCLRTVYYAIAALEARALLRVERRHRPYQSGINVYTVVLPWLREFDWRYQREILHKRRHAPPLHPHPEERKIPEKSPAITREFLLFLGLEETGEAFQASLAARAAAPG